MNNPQSRFSRQRSRLETVMKPDNVLAREAQHNPEAFAELYRRYIKSVYSYQIARTGDVHDAQDLTSQTFLAAQESITNFQGRGKFATWLLAIASHKTADHFRRQQATKQQATLPLESADQEADPSTVSAEEAIDHQWRLEQVTQALGKLTPARAEAIVLRIFGGLSAAEVGQVMGRSEGAAKMLVCRALTDLRNYLKPAATQE